MPNSGSRKGEQLTSVHQVSQENESLLGTLGKVQATSFNSQSSFLDCGVGQDTTAHSLASVALDGPQG